VMQSLCKEGHKMVSSFDAIAWIDHGASIEVTMPKIFRFSKDIPEKGVGAALSLDDKDSTTLNEPLSLSGEDSPDKATAVLTGFMDTIFNEGAHNWSPEERARRVDACLAEVASIQKADDKNGIEDVSRKLRQQIQTGEFDSPQLVRQTPPHTATAPGRPQPDVRLAIRKLAESIEFH